MSNIKTIKFQDLKPGLLVNILKFDPKTEEDYYRPVYEPFIWKCLVLKIEPVIRNILIISTNANEEPTLDTRFAKVTYIDNFSLEPQTIIFEKSKTIFEEYI